VTMLGSVADFGMEQSHTVADKKFAPRRPFRQNFFRGEASPIGQKIPASHWPPKPSPPIGRQNSSGTELSGPKFKQSGDSNFGNETTTELLCLLMKKTSPRPEWIVSPMGCCARWGRRDRVSDWTTSSMKVLRLLMKTRPFLRLDSVSTLTAS
jgi:hypothetical protein